MSAPRGPPAAGRPTLQPCPPMQAARCSGAKRTCKSCRAARRCRRQWRTGACMFGWVGQGCAGRNAAVLGTQQPVEGGDCMDQWADASFSCECLGTDAISPFCMLAEPAALCLLLACPQRQWLPASPPPCLPHKAAAALPVLHADPLLNMPSGMYSRLQGLLPAAVRAAASGAAAAQLAGL